MLDINVLIALFDPDHPKHVPASDWFDLNYVNGWLTCPLTQNGCLRILCQPEYANAVSLQRAFELLQAAVSTQYHQFIADDVSILDDTLVDARRLSGHRQLTDAYLLALAVRHDARLVTLDRRIPLTTVRGAAEENLVVL